MSREKASIAKRAAGNSLYSMLASGWYLLSRFLLTPFILHYLSMAEYGLWSLCFVVMSFLAMTSMGFEGAYVKYVAEFHAGEKMHRINALMSTGLFLSIVLAIILLVILWLGMEPLLKLLDIEQGLRRTAAFVFMGTGLVFMLDISLNCFGRALDGMQYIALTAKVRLISSFLELILIVVFLLAGFGVYGMMWAFFIRYLLTILINMGFAFKLIPGLRISLGYCDRQSLKLFISYGGRMQLLGFIGIFMSTYDRLIITRVLGLAATGMYEVGRKIPFTGARIPAEISGAVMPALSHLQGKDDPEQARELFLSASRYMGMLSALLFCYLFAVAPQAIYVWLGPGYEEAVSVMHVVAAGVLVNLLTGASSAAAKGLGRLDWEIRYAVLNLVLCIVMTPLLSLWLGLMGAALGVAGSTAVASVYFISITNRFFTISATEYFRQILHPVVASVLAGAMLFYLLPLSVAEDPGRIRLTFLLAVAGILYLVLSALFLWVSNGLDGGEKLWLRQCFQKIVRRRAA